MIIDDELRKLLVEPLKNGSKLTCVFDCCHSGTILDLRCNYKVIPGDDRCCYMIDVDKHYKPSIGNVTLLSGCTDKQTSADAFEAGSAQGAMTYCLLMSYKKIKDKGKTPTIKSLIKNLTIFIKQRGYKQIPQLSTGTLLDLNSNFSVT